RFPAREAADVELRQVEICKRAQAQKRLRVHKLPSPRHTMSPGKRASPGRRKTALGRRSIEVGERHGLHLADVVQRLAQLRQGAVAIVVVAALQTDARVHQLAVYLVEAVVGGEHL